MTGFVRAYVCVRVCAYAPSCGRVRARVHACERVCACVRACIRMYVCVHACVQARVFSPLLPPALTYRPHDQSNPYQRRTSCELRRSKPLAHIYHGAVIYTARHRPCPLFQPP